MRLSVHPLDASCREDFYRLHSQVNGCDWCFCVAWWLPDWDGFQQRTSEENRRLRDDLFDCGEYDGYLLYGEGEPVGWCQVGPRDRLENLVNRYHLSPDPEVWAITCFQIIPTRRRLGFATRLLTEILHDLRARGVRRVEAFPNRGDIKDAEDLWNGPEAMFTKAGFRVVKEEKRGLVMEIRLADSP
jgi:ribosomal protein S18 acetylase RimI-like enzyme